ncbi:hypothetical protein [Massilia antarctica]|uniref:hypothetical protein n=1 Tax=Massilia antarctica TaxID=2765360 RepID=UPI0006BB771D|nr:hypothetical protein [Massilia sp. H27-R4]MCY0910807.1 hypothetical protein [Massilia sp. H27-R4]CUI08811.1 hypothetical protein BN2497_12399 [Janthinobacterium sp. CG23_2]CUU32597.1 hypothetical protein BN3177_12399 [Janthinobacterium sp. CG23_2]
MTRPLTLISPVLPGTSAATVVAKLALLLPQINAALESIGTVHFARLILLDRSQPTLQPDLLSVLPSDNLSIAIITSFDGDFSTYIHDFVAQLSDEFDALLSLTVGGAAMTPVVDHVAEFEAFIAENNISEHIPNTYFFSAYPQTVQEILAAF